MREIPIEPQLSEIVRSGYFMVGLFLAVFVWPFDAVIDIYVFGDTITIWQEIFNPGLREVYVRSLFSVSFIAFGFFTSVSIFKNAWAHQQIMLKEEKASLFLNSTGDGIYGIDLNGECTFANQACLGLLGFQSEQELLGKDMHELIHHTHNDGYHYPIEECKIFHAFQEGKGVQVDDEMLWRADGSSFPAEYRSFPMRCDGEIIGSVVSFTDITDKKAAGAEREKADVLNRKTIEATTAFLKGEKSFDVFTTILHNILDLTESEFGFIGDVLYDESGAPYLKSRVITNIAWDQASRELYQPEGMEFRNLDTLFGHVMTTKKMVLSNSPADDKRAGGIPKGHPPLNSFLGIPLMRGEDIIGMLGLANRPDGYNETLFNFIEPFTNVCAYILWGMQLNDEKKILEKRLLSFFKVSQEGILFHEKGIITDINPKAAELSGYDHGDLVGRNVLDFVAPESREKVINKIKYQSTEPYEVVGQRKDGSKSYAEVISKSIEIEGKELRAVSFRDITERKKLEQERIRVAAELTQLIDTANAPIFGIDTQGRVNEWNQTTAKITGYKKDDVMGQDLVQDFITEEYRKPVKQVLDNALQGVETTNYDFPLHTKGGKRLEILLNATSRRDMDGNIIGVIGFGQDITELKLKETALQQAQKMEAVGQLTGGIAHDFNNLLSIISGNLRFLQQDIGKTSDAIDELFEDAMSAADDGVDLTQRLLAFSRNRALQAEEKNVNDTIEKFVRFLTRTLGEGIELDIALPSEDLFINVDSSQLENALLNLSLNARDAMPNGGRITISATRYNHGDGDKYSLAISENDYIKISVTDTGTGISSEDLPHVYEPFFTTKEVGKGSGLGLSMVYGFTQQSGGACHIKSTPGKGTTVSMFFPEIPESKKIEKAKVGEELTMRGSEVILVVEDEPRVRRVALRDLKKLGYTTLEAENADMARAIIESGENIDLLFSDVLMPGEMDGHMLAIWVEEKYPEIKVVLTSGYSKGKTDVSRDKAHQFPLVRKPYAIDKLAMQIRATLAEYEELSVIN